MKKRNNKILSRLAKARFFSPEGFFACAVVIAIAFAGLEALGLRSSVAALTGANPAAEGWPVLCTACLYLLCYLARVVLAPILLSGSIFLLLLDLIMGIFHQKAELF